MRIPHWLVALVACAMLAGCGQKGPLEPPRQSAGAAAETVVGAPQ